MYHIHQAANGHNHVQLNRLALAGVLAVRDTNRTCTVELTHSPFQFNAPGADHVQALKVFEILPNAKTFPVGESVWYAPSNKPVWSDGAAWRDCAGNPVP